MTIEEMLRAGQVRTAENGLVYAVIPEDGAEADEAPVAKLVSVVPQALAPRMGRSACYFVPWLTKQRRTAAVATAAPPPGDTRKELCHHLEIKSSGNLLIISRRFYEHDSYGLALEFFDKVAYLAALQSAPGGEFEGLLRKQMEGKAGELTPETWDWRLALNEATAEMAEEAWQNYRRAAEADALGLYMAALYTDVYYEDLFENDPGFTPLAPELLYERVRLAERLYRPNRGYALHIIRQRPRRRRPAAS